MENPLIIGNMTQLCYTLEEAAQRLNVSETVLFRLSQAFKVPESAYDPIGGGLSFKGDPVFTEPELAFFREIKERLLAGETLETLKRHPPNLFLSSQASVRTERPIAVSALRRASLPPTPSLSPTSKSARAPDSPTDASNDEFPDIQSSSSTLREIENPRLLHRLAEQSLKRYKTQHGVGLGQVFKKILNGIILSSASKPAPGTPSLLFPQIIPVEWRPAFFSQRSPANCESSPIAPISGGKAPDTENYGSADSSETPSTVASSAIVCQLPYRSPSYEEQPKVLDNQLSLAARQLRERALKKPGRQA